jgi:hypothetical protein
VHFRGLFRRPIGAGARTGGAKRFPTGLIHPDLGLDERKTLVATPLSGDARGFLGLLLGRNPLGNGEQERGTVIRSWRSRTAIERARRGVVGLGSPGTRGSVNRTVRSSDR